MPIDTSKYDDIFKRVARKYEFGSHTRLILKSIVMVESHFDHRAYRFEPALFKRLKGKDPYWADKDQAIVSASYGLAQILFTTAWALGLKPDNWRTLNHAQFEDLAESIYDPEANINYEAQLLRSLLKRIWAEKLPEKYEHLSAMDIALARYNGGSAGNPTKDGVLRTQKYVDKVWRAHAQLLPKEKP